MLNQFDVSAQNSNLRLGFQISPTITKMKTDDSTIDSKGGNLGIRIGALGEYYLSENIALTSGLNLSFHQGGKLIHTIGGNFFPNSTLSNDVLNTGDKPLPEGVKLTYSLQTLDIPFSLKLRTKEIGYFRPYIELPMLRFSFTTQARGDIEGAGVSSEKENIRKDVAFANLSIGAGIGTEYAISESMSFVFGIYLNSTQIDVTSNEAYKAFANPNDTPGNPDDDFIRQDEDSKGKISGWTVRMGILF